MLGSKHARSVIYGLTVISTIMFSGCKPSQHDAARIQTLELQVSEQRTEIDWLKKQAVQTDDAVRKTHEQILEVARANENMVALLNQTASQLETVADQLERAPTNKVRTVRYYVPSQPAYTTSGPQSTRMGIPASVYDQIAADSAAKWPGNYEMQKFTIEEQVSAWKSLHR